MPSYVITLKFDTADPHGEDEVKDAFEAVLGEVADMLDDRLIAAKVSAKVQER